jgi:acyl-[acyl-carrier-protein] desaturase
MEGTRTGLDAFCVPDPPQLQADCYRLYREFFDLAQSKRRWSLRDDMPWKQCNQSLDPAITDVVESFCTVELIWPITSRRDVRLSLEQRFLVV